MLLMDGKKRLVTNDIIEELKNALRNDRYPYDETVYIRAIEEIEMLRTICNDLRTELQQPTAQISDSDIVARLKSAAEVHKDGISNYGNDFYPPSTSWNACERLNDAADEIERLRDENTVLRKAVGEEGRANRITMLYKSAQTEIEQLRSALALACGELSGYGPHTNNSPDHLMQELLDEARRG